MICDFAEKYQALFAKEKSVPREIKSKRTLLQDAQADFDGASLFTDTHVRSIIFGKSMTRATVARRGRYAAYFLPNTVPGLGLIRVGLPGRRSARIRTCQQIIETLPGEMNVSLDILTPAQILELPPSGSKAFLGNTGEVPALHNEENILNENFCSNDVHHKNKTPSDQKIFFSHARGNRFRTSPKSSTIYYAYPRKNITQPSSAL